MSKRRKINDYIVCGEVTKIIIVRKSGEVIEALIDTEDLNKVINHPHPWHAHYEKRIDNYYIVSVLKNSKGKYSPVRLHRFVTNCPDGYVPDHINHNTIDNRKSNLRIVTQQVNLINKSGAQKCSKSGVRGVSFHKVTGKWYARVCLGGVEVYGELFDSFNLACVAVKKAREHYYNRDREEVLREHRKKTAPKKCMLPECTNLAKFKYCCTKHRAAHATRRYRERKKYSKLNVEVDG